MPAPLIDALIDKRDSFEVVRDEVAAILLAETTNQQTLAAAAARDPHDWALDVYLERSNPWAEYLDLPDTEANPQRARPIVNVWFNNLSFDMAAGNVVERQKATAIYHIDCYAYGVSAQIAEGGHIPGDAQAAFEAHRTARLVRNIMMAATYTYLGMRGVVWRRWITAIDAFQPPLEGNLAQQIAAARVSLQVEFSEFSPQVEGVPLELISVRCKRAETGQLFFTANFPYT